MKTTCCNTPNVEGKSLPFLFVAFDIKTGARELKLGYWQTTRQFYSDMAEFNKVDPNTICITWRGILGSQDLMEKSGVN